MPKITFINAQGNPQTIQAPTGQSLMQVAANQGLKGIVAECGGSAMCATCHVYVEPAWIAPLSLRNENPDLGHVIAGGAPNNPMGERALELNLSEIAIHGTAAFMRASIGTAASHGCIRMLNEHIIDLFDRVSVGTRVLAEP